MNNQVRVWGGRVGASAIGVAVSVFAAIFLLQVFGQLVGAIAALGLAILIARWLAP